MEKSKAVRPHAIVFVKSDRAAKQSFKDQCNVHKIIETFNRTGQLMANSGKPQYGDFTAVPELRAAMDARIQVNAFFQSLKPEIRDRFKTVEDFYAFVTNPENRDEMLKIGILEKVVPEPEKVQSVRVVSSEAVPPVVPVHPDSVK